MKETIEEMGLAEVEMTTAELYSCYVAPTYSRYALAPVRGRGAWIEDETGRKYLDFGTGIAVCALGHSHPVMVEAIQRQAEVLQHCSNLYHIREQGLLARDLVERVVEGPGRVFFCNSGAEANEALIKLARKFGEAVRGPGGEARYEVITFEGSFHGRTMAGISATAQPKVKVGFAPLLEGFCHVAWEDVEALEAAVTPRTAAVLLEPVQGEGGIRPASASFLREVAALCRERNLLLLFDEVQCGMGRVGRMAGWKAIVDDPAVAPDGVSWAKGLGGGVPIGAAWIRDRAISGEPGAGSLVHVLGPGSHGSTFGGGPLVAAASRAVLGEVLTRDLPANAIEQGRFLREGIESWRCPWIRKVRGLGLMLGIALDGDAMRGLPEVAESGATAAGYAVAKLMERGLLTVPAGPDVVRLLPALDVTRAEAEEALGLLHDFFRSLDSNPPT